MRALGLLAVSSAIGVCTAAPFEQTRRLTEVAYECAPVSEQYSGPDREALGRGSELFDKQGLEEALRESQVVESRIYQGPHNYVTDVVTLRDNSELVVIGTIRRTACYVRADSRQIVTGLTVEIEQALKGKGAQDEQVTVIVPGGRVILGPESWAQTRTIFIRSLRTGDRIISFLISNDTTRISPAALLSGMQPQRQFMMFQGVKGTFVIGSDDTLAPVLINERPGPTMAVSYGGKKLSLLLEDLKNRSGIYPLARKR